MHSIQQTTQQEAVQCGYYASPVSHQNVSTHSHALFWLSIGTIAGFPFGVRYAAIGAALGFSAYWLMDT